MAANLNSRSTAGPLIAELPAQTDAHGVGADTSWQLAISLLAAWRAAGGDQQAVSARLAEVAKENGDAAAEQAAAGLAHVAGMFIELYADRLGVSPDDVLCDVATLTRDTSLYG